MNKKIMGVTVGTSLSPSKIEEKIKPIKTVNNVAPDENGNVEFKIPEGADGKTPYIKDGNWWIGETDTGVKAEGKDGKDYVLTSADKTEIAEKVCSIPKYVKAEAESVIDRVIKAQGSRTFTFGAITDLHYGSWGYYEGVTDYPDGIKHACQALKYIDERIKLDAVAVLGDYTDGMAYDQYDTAVYDFKGVNAVLDKLRFSPNLRLVGNHDFHIKHSPLTYRYITAYSDDVEWGNCLGGYFYKDFTAQKIRVICLNTSEINHTSVSPTTEQYRWFINSLNLSAKENASDWHILILSHIPLDFWADGGNYTFTNILNAYQTSGVWDNGKSIEDMVACDFSDGKNVAKIIGNIHGHVHNLKVDRLQDGSATDKINVWRMATPNACFGKENKYDGYQEETSYLKTANSATDTAFCIYCIDLDTYTIKAICYGAGYDRELVYKSKMTNQIPISTDENGNVYNNKGYKENTRWSGSSNAESGYEGVDVTGYIPITFGDTIRLKNITLTAGAAKNEVWYFEQKGTSFFHRVVGEFSNEELDENGNLIGFTAEATGFMRVVASNIDDTSIITINEPIV